MSLLERPTPSLVQEYVAQFQKDKECVDTDNAITVLIRTFPHNTKIEEVLVKVPAINGLYSAGVLNKALYAVSKLICESNVDQKLAQGSLDVVGEIAYGSIGENNRYPFATKYCHWHRPDFYPIYDSRASKVLCAYQKVDGFSQFSSADLWKYPRYKEVIEQFISHYGLTGTSFRELDKFLWRYKV